MLLVVYGHVSTELDPSICATHRLFYLIRLPLFFFINGFFASFPKEIAQGYFRGKLIKRFRYQFLPTILMWLLFLVVFSIPIKDSILQETKSGFWFVYVAIQYYLFYIIYYNLIERRIQSKPIQLFLITGICVLSQLTLGYLNNKNCEAIEILSTLNFLTYLPFFFIGVLCKRYFRQFNRLISENVVFGGLLVAFIGIYFIPSNMSFMGKIGGIINLFIYLLHRICGLLILFRVFQFYSDIFSKKTQVGRALTLIGQYTLEIYLIHMFILLSLGLMNLTSLYGWDTLKHVWAFQIIIYGIISLFICTCCLLIARIVRIVPPLYQLFLGQYEKSI